MKQLTALLWKEWFEVRLFLAIGLFVFLGLPLIGGLQDARGPRFEIQASLWVFALGGVLAVIIAVGIVVRDLNGRLEEFWRSRPVSTVRWLLVKYLVGLTVVLMTLGVPLVVEILLNRQISFPGLMLKWQPFLWAALYSLSFAIACLLRRGAHAAMLSVAVMLLVYFLPSIFPPIHFLSLERAMDQDQFSTSSRIGFAAGMIGLSVMGLSISLLAARHDWRIESDRKLIYWSIGGAVLILFSSAAFQVASNLPLLQKVDLPGNEQIMSIQCDGSRGLMLTRSRLSFVRTIHISQSGIELGPAIEMQGDYIPWEMSVWRPEQSDVFYNALSYSNEWNETTEEHYPRLQTVSLRDGTVRVDVQSFPEMANRNWPFGRRLYTRHDRLYLVGPELMTFDISDPFQPKLISTGPFAPGIRERSGATNRDEDPETRIVPLPPIPDISPEERLKMIGGSRWLSLDGDILVDLPGNHITTYRLEKLTDVAAIFRRIGRYDPSPVEQWFGNYSWLTATRDGLCFESGYNGPGGGSNVTIFDVTGPRPKPVGHFAFPDQDLRQLCPLPGHKLLAASRNRLYLLGPPPQRK